MNSNEYRPAIFTAITRPRPAPAPARHDPGLPGCAANTVGEKATCEKRNRHRLIALALVAMFALAGSGTVKAESSLKGENAKELERLLAVPAENKAVDFAFRKPPRIPASSLDRYLMWNEIPSTRSRSTIRRLIQKAARIRAVSASSSVRTGRAMRWQSFISPCSMPKMPLRKNS